MTTIPGPTVALLVIDDLLSGPTTPATVLIKATRPMLALTAKEPTEEQRRAWALLPPEHRNDARNECLRNVPATLTISETPLRWSVRSER